MALVNDIDDLNKALNDFALAGSGAVVNIKDWADAFSQILDTFSELNDVSKNTFKQMKNSIDEYSLSIEKVKRGSISVNELNNKIAASSDRRRKILGEMVKLESDRATASRRQRVEIDKALKIQQNMLNIESRLINGYKASIEVIKDMKSNWAKGIPILQDIVKEWNSIKYQMDGSNSKVAILSTKLGRLSGKALLFLMKTFVKSALDANKQIVALSKNLNMSSDNAEGLKLRYAEIANSTNDILVNSTRLVEAQIALNKEYGLAVRMGDEMTITFSKLTKYVGLSESSAAGLAGQATLTGQSLREAEENALGSAYAIQMAYGVQLNQKDILEVTGKVTGQVRSNLAANPEAIARAVAQAKLFGAELNDIVASSKSLLNFESSIENELKAELITGKQLNLERARALSLAGDQEGLAKELEAQAGNFTEYSRLNVLQQQELADAFGLSADRLSDILFKQQFQNANASELRAIGKGELADRLEQLTVQEKITASIENFKSALSDVAVVLLPIIEGFVNIVSSIAKAKGLVTGLLGVTAALAARSLTLAVANIFGHSMKAGPVLGAIMAAAGVAAMMASISKAKSAAPPMAEGGVVLPRQGGTIVNVGEAGESEAIVPLSKMNQFNSSNNDSQPIVIHNSFSNFKSSGWDQLTNTQIRQASPTFI